MNKSLNSEVSPEKLIAPCGMNCALCIAYQRSKNSCPGCHSKSLSKSAYCQNCIIKNCSILADNNYSFCYQCDKFPCTRLKNLDKRYRSKYGMSMLANLAFIHDNGLENFLRAEAERWSCPECNSLLTVHKEQCTNCGKPLNKRFKIPISKGADY